MNNLKCKRHNINKECLAGCSAHPDNWYCPECDKEADKTNDSNLLNELLIFLQGRTGLLQVLNWDHTQAFKRLLAENKKLKESMITLDVKNAALEHDISLIKEINKDLK